MKFLFSISAVLVIICAHAQTINIDKFDQKVYTCEFDKDADANVWPAINNDKDLILIQEGQYYLKRKNTFKGRMVFPELAFKCNAYEVQASIMSLNSIPSGICFGFDATHSSGIVLEIYKNKFRVKKIEANGKITYLSGKNEKDSWQKFSMLIKEGAYNDIDIFALDNVIDIYLNNFFAWSGTYESENNCEFGIILNPGSEIRVRKMNLFSPEPILNPANKTVDSVSNTTSINFLDKIVELNKELDQTKRERDQLINQLENCRSDNIMLNAYINTNINVKLQSKIDDLEAQNQKLKESIEKLKAENRALEEFKEFYNHSGKDDDIVEFLYNEIHKLEAEIAHLKKQIK